MNANTNITNLYDAALKIINTIKENYKHDVGPDSALTNFTWDVEFNDNTFSLILHLPREWYWVEHGRNPSDKMPPVSAIRQWIEVKRLVPKNFMGVPMEKAKTSMAWAIAKKIQDKGYYSPGHHGKHTIEDSMYESQEYINDLALEITKMVGQEVTDDLIHIADGMKNIKETSV